MTTGPIRGIAVVRRQAVQLDRVLGAAVLEGRKAQRRITMHEKLKALREYRRDNQELLDLKLTRAFQKAQEVYPRAHDHADAQLAEAMAIEAECDALDDEVNQAMGGNRPPQGDGSAPPPPSSETSSGTAR